MRENDNDNNLFFVCSIIEYIARKTKNTKEYIVKKLGKESINKIYALAEVYHCENIEKILKEWYGPNCLKKWDGKKWIETLPVEKRRPKHTVDLNLNGDKPIEKQKSF